MSAAMATLKVIAEEKLCKEAKDKGDWLMMNLESMKSEFQEIKEVRGIGLMIGVVMDKPAAPYVQKFLKMGFITNATAVNVLRLVPPLNIPRKDLEDFLKTFKKVLGKERVSA
jgi:acetylornithine/N-succinyldiaminopimelate aminotransferase